MNRRNRPTPRNFIYNAKADWPNIKADLKARLLDRHDMAEVFKVSLNTIYNWTSQGLFKTIAFPGRTYYDALDIEKVLEAYKQQRVPVEKRGRKKKGK